MGYDPRLDPALATPSQGIAEQMTADISQRLAIGTRRVDQGAGGYGMREPRFAPSPYRLIIDGDMPNSSRAAAHTIPMGTLPPSGRRLHRA